MLLDSLNQFSVAQAITVDAISGNVIDLGPLGATVAGANASANTIRDIGAGQQLYVSALAVTSLTDADGAPTLAVTLESDSAVGLDSSATVHATLCTGLLEASLTAGTWFIRNFPIPSGAYERYLGLRYTTSIADFDGGTVSAWLHYGRWDDRTYESGFGTGVN